MSRLSQRIRSCLLALPVIGLASLPPAAALTPQEELIDKSRMSFEKLITHPEFTELKGYVQHAKAVLIIPSLLKGGFFIGGEGGSGVLIARRPEGGWGQPAFYTLGAGSLGIQFGGQVSEVVFTFMTEKGLDAVLTNQVKLGADLSIAVGPMGKSVGAGTTTNFGSDMYMFAKSEGLFGGGALQGAVIAKRDDWNQGFYGRPVTPRQIIFTNEVANPRADPLRQVMAPY